MLSPAAIRASKAATFAGSSCGCMRGWVIASAPAPVTGLGCGILPRRPSMARAWPHRECTPQPRKRTIDGDGGRGYLPPMSTERTASAAAGGGDVSFAVDDGVGTIEFSHPKGNSLPAELLRRLADGVETLGADPRARVIV